jgi:hypothetical protein
VVEDTLGKCGRTVTNLTGELQPGGRIVPGLRRIPVNVQRLLGNIDELADDCGFDGSIDGTL